MMASMTFAVSLLCICAGLVIYFEKREQKLADQIQKMLDDAIAGKFEDKRLDETKMSAIENSMWRYLCDKEAGSRKLAEEKQQMQTHISDISHQAVIPIANIILYSQLLEERLDLQDLEEGREILDEIASIRGQAETLDFLIEALVKLSRLETGIININKERQPIQSVLDAVKNQFQAQADQKKLLFSIVATEEAAVFDRKWTIEAVSNIVDNAVKYTPCGGKISINVESYASLIRMDIMDTGMGIAEVEQANVFQRFYRSRMAGDKPGVGIGLYLAREVMKAQDGYIKLSSKVGEGSIFSLYFMK